MHSLLIELLLSVLITSIRAEEVIPDIECPEDGYFPSLKSCGLYNICFNGYKTVYGCENHAQLVYSPTTRSCVRKSEKNICYKFICKDRTPHFIAYPGDPSLYALCYTEEPIMLYKCPPGKEFNEKKQMCVTDNDCKSEGNKCDPNDCTSFYECFLTETNSYEMNKRECPTNSWFNPDLSQCTMVGAEACIQPNTPTQEPLPSDTTFTNVFPQSTSPSSVSPDNTSITSVSPSTLPFTSESVSPTEISSTSHATSNKPQFTTTSPSDASPWTSLSPTFVPNTSTSNTVPVDPHSSTSPYSTTNVTSYTALTTPTILTTPSPTSQAASLRTQLKTTLYFGVMICTLAILVK